MSSIKKILIDLVVVIVVITVSFFLYDTYKEPIAEYVFGLDKVGVFIRDVPVTVSIANDPDERKEGLSGVASLADQEGKLFIFDKEGYYGIWMKDMNFAIDIIWINDDLEVVHIEENIKPDSYPTVFTPREPARIVLETNAFFVETFNINLGNKLIMPSNKLPSDLRY